MRVSAGLEIPPWVMSDLNLTRIQALMTLMRDVNPIHHDSELAAMRGLRGPVNQGPANLAYIINMLLDWAGPEMVLECLQFRFVEIVTAGDVVTARGSVTSVEEDAGEQRIGCDVWLELPDGTKAVEGTARLRIPTTVEDDRARAA
jgi:acyl dehydratase